MIPLLLALVVETSTPAASPTPCTAAWECAEDVPPLACEWYWRAQCAGYERDLAHAAVQTAAERLALRTPEACAALAVQPIPVPAPIPLFEVVTAAGAGLGLGLIVGGALVGGEDAPRLGLAGGIALALSGVAYAILGDP